MVPFSRLGKIKDIAVVILKAGVEVTPATQAMTTIGEAIVGVVILEVTQEVSVIEVLEVMILVKVVV